jgi:hypothetical protein
MSLDIVWVPTAPDSPLGVALGGSSVSLPHFAENKSPEPRKKLSVTLTVETLVLGILITSSKSVSPGPKPTARQLAVALAFARVQLGASSDDEVCVNAAAELREVCDGGHAIRALRRAIELVPEAVFCRADLITSLFMRLSASRIDADAMLEEIVRVFLEWHDRDLSTCDNEEVTFYCGFSALTYCGRLGELNEIEERHQAKVASFPWLTEQVLRLRNVEPGRVEEIVFEE